MGKTSHANFKMDTKIESKKYLPSPGIEPGPLGWKAGIKPFIPLDLLRRFRDFLLALFIGRSERNPLAVSSKV